VLNVKICGDEHGKKRVGIYMESCWRVGFKKLVQLVCGELSSAHGRLKAFEDVAFKETNERLKIDVELETRK